MLRQRILTAATLVLIMAAALLWSPSAFAVVATAVLVFALAEWLQLIGVTRAMSIGLALVIGVVLLFLSFAARDRMAIIVFPLIALASILWLMIAAVLLQPNAMKLRLPRALGIPLALLLVLAAWLALMRLLSESATMLLSVLLIVWIADTAAYFAGRAFGRRKLAPHISPGKTWAGVIGAVLAVLLVALLIWQFAPTAPIYSNGLFVAVGIAAASALLALLVALAVIGDLFESLLKRQAGVKDSGQLLPGHGGVLDRVDALVPVLPAAVLIQWLVR